MRAAMLDAGCQDVVDQGEAEWGCRGAGGRGLVWRRNSVGYWISCSVEVGVRVAYNLQALLAACRWY